MHVVYYSTAFFATVLADYIEVNIIPIAATVSPKLKKEILLVAQHWKKTEKNNGSGTLSQRSESATVVSIISCRMILSKK